MERMERLEGMVGAQNEKLDKLEDLVYRVIHRSRVNGDTKHEERLDSACSELENRDPNIQKSAKLESPTPSPARKASVAASYRPIPST